MEVVIRERTLKVRQVIDAFEGVMKESSVNMVAGKGIRHIVMSC